MSKQETSSKNQDLMHPLASRLFYGRRVSAEARGQASSSGGTPRNLPPKVPMAPRITAPVGDDETALQDAPVGNGTGSSGTQADHVDPSQVTDTSTVPDPSDPPTNLDIVKEEEHDLAPPTNGSLDGPVTMSILTMFMDRLADKFSQLVTVQMSQVESRIRSDFGMVLDRVDREYVPETSFSAIETLSS